MASLFTNASAQTALKTLTATSKNLSNTQNRVSTGYRINTAEDNAAYWSIATTLRSDVNALGAVKDALGLGAATVDTVYTGINDTKDLLDQVKSKLVTASQTGVPKAQVQAEITQLQNRLKDTAKSTVINSESWLTQDSSATGYTSNKDVVGSFTRAGGVVSIETIKIDINNTKLYENSKTINDDVQDSLNDNTTADAVLEKYATAVKGAYDDAATQRTKVAAVKLTFVSTAATAADKLPVLTAATGTGFIGISAGGATPSTVAIGSDAGGIGEFIGATATADLKKAIDAELQALGTFKNGATVGTGKLANYDGATVLTPEENAKVSEAVTETNVKIANLINDAITKAELDKVGVARTEYQTAAAGDTNNQKLGIFDKVRTTVSEANGSNAKAVSVSNIDISGLGDTDFDKGVLNAYITAVDDALQELTLSASIIGAAKARIGGNQTFVQNLIDANNRGIGQLVDADLNEESTKLKALQVQEQLAVQALGIANSSTQSILSLFQ